jgi:hypothetical protein
MATLTGLRVSYLCQLSTKIRQTVVTVVALICFCGFTIACSGTRSVITTADPTLCHMLIMRATHLVLRRSVPHSTVYVQTFAFRSNETSSDVSAVRAVARQLCALPVLPKSEAIACIGAASYSLTFYGAAGRLEGPITFQASGCNAVEVPRGQARFYRPGSALWPTLGIAIGLSAATQSTFQGSKPRLKRQSSV